MHYDMSPLAGLTQAERDAAYSNSGAVGNFPDIMARFQARSAAFYSTHDCQRGLCYGPGERQRFDWMAAAGTQPAPVFIFIHGGYWQYCAKEDFSFVAQGPLAHGMHVALVEYTLAPQASMTRIVGDIAAFLDHLATQVSALNIDARRVCLSGHSAGGHLTAVHRDHPMVTHTLPISALVDLAPIRETNLNHALNLTDTEVQRFSPLRHLHTGQKPCTVVVGGAELSELQRHSQVYADAGADCLQRVNLLKLPGLHHFSVLEDLAHPHGRQAQALRDLFEHQNGEPLT